MLHQNTKHMQPLLFHTNQQYVKSNNVPATTKNTLVVYNFGNTKHELPSLIWKGHEVYKQNLSLVLTNINLNNIHSTPQDTNTNITLFSNKNHQIITQKTKFEYNIYDKNLNYYSHHAFKSFLRKEYLINLSLGDRMNINYLISSFFLTIQCLTSEPRYLITSDKIIFKFYFYPLFQGFRSPYFRKHRSKYKLTKRYLLLRNRKFNLRRQGISTKYFMSYRRKTRKKLRKVQFKKWLY